MANWRWRIEGIKKEASKRLRKEKIKQHERGEGGEAVEGEC